MASGAAQAYFNTFSPSEQRRILASWGGADLMDQWYENAVKAGAVPGQGGAPDMDGALAPDAGKGQTFTAADLRAKAMAENWPEDFKRFSDATLQGWINQYWDASKGRFRSMHAPADATGDWVYVFKPTDSVTDPNGDEWGPYGNSIGVKNPNQLAAAHQGGGAAPAAAAPTSVSNPFVTSDPLQAALLNMFQSRQGIFGDDTGIGPTARETDNNLWGIPLAGGGLWWGAGENPLTGAAAPSVTPPSTNPVTPKINIPLPTLPAGPFNPVPSGGSAAPVDTGATSPLAQALLGVLGPQFNNRDTRMFWEV